MLRQFLVESVLICLGGGVVGVVGGALVSALLSRWGGWPTHLSVMHVLGTVAASAAIGVCAGLYPARRAANLDPIDGVRYE